MKELSKTSREFDVASLADHYHVKICAEDSGIDRLAQGWKTFRSD